MKPRNAKFISPESKINFAVQGKYSRKDTGWRLFLKTIIARAYPMLSCPCWR